MAHALYHELHEDDGDDDNIDTGDDGDCYFQIGLLPLKCNRGKLWHVHFDYVERLGEKEQRTIYYPFKYSFDAFQIRPYH